jgi:hypothetical protein
MGFKTTTDPFSIRTRLTLEVPTTGGANDNNLNAITMDTHLDTLNREVLIIHEVDFDVIGSTNLVNNVFSNAAGNPNSAWWAHATVQTGSKVTTIDDVGSLSDAKSVATIIVEPYALNFDSNPDTATFASTGVEQPLAIVADPDVTLAGFIQWYSMVAAPGTDQPLAVDVRILASRARADADTYAAILTGAF